MHHLEYGLKLVVKLSLLNEGVDLAKVDALREPVNRLFNHNRVEPELALLDSIDDLRLLF